METFEPFLLKIDDLQHRARGAEVPGWVKGI